MTQSDGWAHQSGTSEFPNLSGLCWSDEKRPNRMTLVPFERRKSPLLDAYMCQHCPANPAICWQESPETSKVNWTRDRICPRPSLDLWIFGTLGGSSPTRQIISVATGTGQLVATDWPRGHLATDTTDDRDIWPPPVRFSTYGECS